MAYERKADRVWILNVGDIKPLEVPISYYFDLAYDMPRWTAENIGEWLELWATREFGEAIAPATAKMLAKFSKLAAWRKFELLDPTTFSLVNYNEADNVLQTWADLEKDAQAIYDELSPSDRPAFFEMVLHPVKAGHTVYRIHVKAAKNNLYSEQKRTSTNEYAQEVLDDFRYDSHLTNEYHGLLNGKWNHMMDQTHLGYNYWQQPMRNTIPPLSYVQELESAMPGTVGLAVEGSLASVPGDDRHHELSGRVLTLPPMDPYGPFRRSIDIFARGSVETEWNLDSVESYITVVPSNGVVGGTKPNDVKAYVSIDWSNVPDGLSNVYLNLTTRCAGCPPNHWGASNRQGKVQVKIPLQKRSVPDTFSGFVESDGHISIEAEHATRNSSNDGVSYVVFPDFGHTLSGVGLWPVLADTQTLTTGPVLEYDIHVFSAMLESPSIMVYLAASLNFNGLIRPLKYAMSIDNSVPQEVEFVPPSDWGHLPKAWETAVADNAWKSITHHAISPGSHTLKVWLLEPGITLQKIVVDVGGLRDSYFGPPESTRVFSGDKLNSTETVKVSVGGIGLTQATVVAESAASSSSSSTPSASSEQGENTANKALDYGNTRTWPLWSNLESRLQSLLFSTQLTCLAK